MIYKLFPQDQKNVTTRILILPSLWNILST